MAETTGKVLLSYDINDKWDEVKSTLIHEYAYSEVAQSMATFRLYSLPNTTLFHQSKQVSEAIKDIQKVCLRHKVILEKAVAVLTTEVAYHNDKPLS